MQFFPTAIADIFSSPPSFLDETYSYAEIKEGSRSFGDIFNNLAIFNPANTPGLPPGFRSVRDDRAAIKSSDLLFLKEKLEAKGVSEESAESLMQQLNALACAPGVGNILSAAARLTERKSSPLNEQEELAFSALLHGTGFNQEEVATLREFSSQGQGKKILEALREKISGGTLDLGRDDLALLCRAADISGKPSENILGLLGERAEISLDADAFGRLFSEAGAEMNREKAEASFLRAALPSAIEDMFARQKLEKDPPSGDNKKSALAGRTETMARELATSAKPEDEESGLILRRSLALSLEGGAEKEAREDAAGSARLHGRTDSPLREKTDSPEKATPLFEKKDLSPQERPVRAEQKSLAAPARDSASGSENPGRVRADAAARLSPEAAEHTLRDERPLLLQAEAAPQKAEPRIAAPRIAVPERAAPATENGNLPSSPKPAENRAVNLAPLGYEETPLPEEKAEGKNSGQAGNWRKSAGAGGSAAETEPASSGSRAKTGIIFAEASGREGGSLPAGLTGMPQAENSAGEARQAKAYFYREEIFSQVEHGLVRSLADGSKQIVLRLDPPELGKLTLSLTLAQGEVRAVIRTENSATAQVISEQLAQLKISLEEQGFKVSGLEVESNALENHGAEQWDRADEHNRQQEMREQSNFLRLAHSRPLEGEILARSMQNTTRPASNSVSGLDLIA
ncbi:MAG: flagellar hook-length control protein FliK [Deltaproteobacteria bacterium]|jgi:flagellar hook-length control protein FliK|nr:flagellar hook-length control protein FliK [Deltaproteobacteria bacterium]